ncbi:DUF1311 domain-containing protein [Salmonella enterica subsp. houtenae]|uniref:DUF1311 domain-containing protein n=2 Tax=Salmonella enterica TaxID=28901 RepID=A0A6V9XFD2_SALER|nr:lysozyme inhibitor LprI family protein [Salmonella enterica]EAA7390877.1 DUF1311 domain-containing protein [Salmonella enterica subsp. enterica]ECE0648019.1 DUF1311 domain-containing protein [Salmonella enterica subsp. houtenae]EDP9793821.1 DUF1311 domain-containing protein [Salmonella enterica subsp. salamae]EEE0986811.1 DUF1311 domain-containing protein [Salmonella enterica subsp. enterica serovar Kiambu]AXE02351.1 DUF1311 domain-containing protein [Salmonella enterica]
MKNILGAFILLFIILTSQAQAISNDEQKHYNKVNSDYIKSDKELNKLYKIKIQQYKKEGADFYGQVESRDIYLKKSQQVWIKMRDASCNYETYESRTGTGFSSIYIQCLLDKTNERIKYLNQND